MGEGAEDRPFERRTGLWGKRRGWFRGSDPKQSPSLGFPRGQPSPPSTLTHAARPLVLLLLQMQAVQEPVGDGRHQDAGGYQEHDSGEERVERGEKLGRVLGRNTHRAPNGPNPLAGWAAGQPEK